MAGLLWCLGLAVAINVRPSFFPIWITNDPTEDTPPHTSIAAPFSTVWATEEFSGFGIPRLTNSPKAAVTTAISRIDPMLEGNGGREAHCGVIVENSVVLESAMIDILVADDSAGTTDPVSGRGFCDG